MNKILNTGGAGILGSHLPNKLLREGKHVLVVDDCFTGAKEILAHLLLNPRLKPMNHDVILSMYAETDQIYNLACPAFPVHYRYDPAQTTKTIVHGAINTQSLAKSTRVRTLQTSTSKVYSNPEVHLQPKDYFAKVNPISIRFYYLVGKRCTETLFFDYNRQHNSDIKIARFFNSYSPRIHPNAGRVVSNCIVQSLRGKGITIYGDGKQPRRFYYVDDLIDALVKMMNSEAGFTGPVNNGNYDEITMLQFAKTVLRLTGNKFKIIYQSLPSDDPKESQPILSSLQPYLAGNPGSI